MSDPLSLLLRLHAECTLQRAGASPALLERKQAGLLAYLWLEGPTPRGKLAGLLWPEADEARARGNLRQSLLKLRRFAETLIDERGGVLALASAAAIEPAPQPAASLLAPFAYDDCDAFARWLEGRRESHRAAQRLVLLNHVRAHAAAGRLDDALSAADGLLALDRESEEAYRTLMEVFYLRGDHAAAISAWDRCREMLRQLYGISPSAATRQLGETILRAAGDVAAQSAPGGANAIDTIPVTVLRPPRLIARADSLQALQAAWQARRAICVTGESGLGKSRLLAEWAARIGPCASVAARPGDAVLPYASLSRLVLAAIDRFAPSLDGIHTRRAAKLLPRLAPLVDGHAAADDTGTLQSDYERAQALLALGHLLGDCVRRGCAAFVVDDLQFADDASIEALKLLAEPAPHEDTRSTPLLFAIGARVEDLSPQGSALLASLEATRRFTRIDLAPLSQDEVADLLACLGVPRLAAGDGAALSAGLWQQVGGNPAFVLESVKLMLSESVPRGAVVSPPGIEAVIARRIALLSPRARHVAQLAAIAGSSYSVALAARALACAPIERADPLRELELRQVLYGREFVHDVIATVVHQGIPAAVREFMHRFVAEDLQAHAGEPALVAGHWQACGEWALAGACYRQAASLSGIESRVQAQCRWLDAAAECFERAGAASERFDVLVARLNITHAPDRVASRSGRIAQLEALAQSEPQRLHAAIARIEWHSDHSRTSAEAVGIGADGVARALAIGREDLAVAFAVALSWQLAMSGEKKAALATLDARRAWVNTQGGPTQRGVFHRTAAGVYGYVDELLPAIEASELAITEFKAQGDLVAVMPALSNIGLFRFWRGELEQAQAVLTEAAVLRDRIEGRGGAVVINIHLGAVLRDLGHYRAALQLLGGALAHAQADSSPGSDATDLVIIENHLAQLWLALGEPAQALASFATDDDSVSARFRCRRIGLRLRIARRHTQVDAALLAQAREAAQALESPFNRVMLELEIACELPPAQATDELARLLAHPVARQRPGLQIHAGVKLADALSAIEDLAQARRVIDEALSLATAISPYDLERSELWCTAYRVLAHSGAEGRAHEVIRQGAQWLRETAQMHVAVELQAAFLSKNPDNRCVLAIADALPR